MSSDACVSVVAAEMVSHYYAFLLLCFLLCWFFVGLFMMANIKREQALAKVLAAVEESNAACCCCCESSDDDDDSSSIEPDVISPVAEL